MVRRDHLTVKGREEKKELKKFFEVLLGHTLQGERYEIL